MLVTEDEAKTKLCPETFGKPMAEEDQKCEGSACMAWRWGQNLHRDREKVGYCGRAGKP